MKKMMINFTTTGVDMGSKFRRNLLFSNMESYLCRAVVPKLFEATAALVP